MRTALWVRACGVYLLLAALYSARTGWFYLQPGRWSPLITISSVAAYLGWAVVAAVAGLGLLFSARWARRLAVGTLVAQTLAIIYVLSPALAWGFGYLPSMLYAVLQVVAATALPAACAYYLMRRHTREVLGSAHLTSASTRQGDTEVISGR